MATAKTASVEMVPSILHIDGTRYEMFLAKIEGTMLGYEDHGVFSAHVDLRYQGATCQGFGGYCYDTYDKVKEKRVGAGIGIDQIGAILKIVGVEKWEDLKGKFVYALKKDEWGLIEGIASATDPTKKHLIFKQQIDEWLAENPQ